MEELKTVVYARNTIEFVTVAAEFCAYLEQSEGRNRGEFVDTVLKLLPLLYLKASLLPIIEGQDDFLPEEFVSEQDYELVRLTLADILSEKDDYMDVFVDEVALNDEVVMKTISEDLTDVYQVARNFVGAYKIGIEENMYEAVVTVTDSFRLYWGQTLVNAMRALHRVKCSGVNDTEENDDVDECYGDEMYRSSLY